MKKLYPVLVLLILVAACGPKEGSLAEKKATLEEKESELATLQSEIDSLVVQIAALDTTAQEDEKLTPVAVQKAKTSAFSHFLEVTGTVSSQKNVLLSAETMGRVVSIPAREGQKVSAGQALVKLNASTLQQQEQEARASYELAKTTFERRARLWKDSIGSEIEYLNAQTQFKAAKNRLGQVQAQLNNATIKSPINGRVDEITVNKGEFLGAGTPVVRVVDMTNLEVEAEVSEEYLGAIKVGDSVTVSLKAIGLEQKQPVIFTGQYINPNNRSFKIKVKLSNSNELIKPNLLANLKIEDYQTSTGLVLSSNVIKQDLTGEYVFVVETTNGKNTIAKRYITKGYTYGDKTEITEGLKVGDKVVTAGYNLVNTGQEVALN